MAMNARRLVELSMVPPLAKELVAQVGTGLVVQQAAVTSLTGTVGTANDAMTALAALAASTLATDFATQKTSLDAVITAQNAVTTANNNNLADLQAKVNAILVALRAAGIIVP